ncbi:hypothetical protein LINPERPRIM_LOCUS41090 [Linum perenne]
MICIIEEWPGDISFCFWRFVAFPREYRVCYLHVYLELVDSETMPSECNVVNQHRGSLSVQTSCTLFNLVCNFQVIHFENYGKLLERDLEVSQYIGEHIRITHYMSKISQRFRIFFVF